MEQKKFFIIGTMLVLALIAIGIWVGMSLGQSRMANGESQYTAVYMTTGDIYFGTLKYFPQLHLENAWYLQRGVGQDNQPQFGVVPITTVLWQPTGDIYLNRHNIVFWTRLQKGSKVEAFMQNPQSAPPPSTGGVVPPGPAPAPSTSTP